MTSRVYDVMLYVDSIAGFESGNFVFGNTSASVGIIANVDPVFNTIKVKLANSLQEFSSVEVIHSNTIITAGTANGTLNSGSLPFLSNVMSSNVTTAIANVTSITPSAFIAEKNAFTQNPIVRLYSIYYPGEWYPPNEYGNPTEQGAGKAWPGGFPINIAEVVGDTASDVLYNVQHGSTSYIPFPVNISNLDQGADGKINELSMTVFNTDNIISALVENPYLVGNNSSNSVVALVNNELVHGIDPRTVNFDPIDVGSEGEEAFDSLTRARANGLVYDSTIVNLYGTANASFDRTQTLSVNGEWQEQKMDTRDLLGAVVEIKTTFANFLDVWPEYSTISNLSANVITVVSALPYRVGDLVRTEDLSYFTTIREIRDNKTIYTSSNLNANTSVGAPLYIINIDTDSDSYILDKYKIDQLEGLTEHIATFGLVSWLQYFKIALPKRKYYKNTCQWTYKGEECQYPGPGGVIPGTLFTLANVNPIAANNQIASSNSGDICAKSFLACTLRNNELHFGGFTTAGRTLPAN